jgi:hypothetical protein
VLKRIKTTDLDAKLTDRVEIKALLDQVRLLVSCANVSTGVQRMAYPFLKLIEKGSQYVSLSCEGLADRLVTDQHFANLMKELSNEWSDIIYSHPKWRTLQYVGINILAQNELNKHHTLEKKVSEDVANEFANL